MKNARPKGWWVFNPGGELINQRPYTKSQATAIKLLENAAITCCDAYDGGEVCPLDIIDGAYRKVTGFNN